MKSFLAGIFAAVIIMAAATMGKPASPQGEAANSNNMPADVYARWETELSNWGRWGKDDQIGALNLITPAKRKQAAALVKEGFSVSLASDADTVQAVDNGRPYQIIRNGINTDSINVSYHGMSHTHLDSLSHIYDKQGRAFNGYVPDKDVVLKTGHTRNSVHEVKNGIFTRGILMDIPRLKGVPYLEPGTPIYPADLEAWEKKAGVKVQAGDALMVRTGRWAARKALGPYDISNEKGKAAGLHPSVLPWLKERGVALMAGDGASMVAPSDGAVHDLSIRLLGMQLIDQADFEALAAAAAARNRWEFLFTVAPLPIPGGTGSPVNPIATF